MNVSHWQDSCRDQARELPILDDFQARKSLKMPSPSKAHGCGRRIVYKALVSMGELSTAAESWMREGIHGSLAPSVCLTYTSSVKMT